MPRIARKYSKIKVYHITIRGIDKQNIFFEEEDKYKFLEIINRTKEKYNYEIYAYCLMDNHVHLVIYDKEQQLSKIMQSIEISYVFYFNLKYGRTGHLFQNRFFSKKIEDLNYFLTVCKYIHRNPEKAGIALTQNYKWSSYQEYIRKKKIISSSLLMHYFDNDISKFADYTLKTLEKIGIEDYIEYEMIPKISDEELAEELIKRFNVNNMVGLLNFFKNKDKKELVECLKEIHKIKVVNISQVARVTKITKRIVESVWKMK